MLNIVLFGPPGAGKGTQSQKIIDQYRLIHLSTGDILRAEISNGTELGLKAKALMDKGELVPDEVVIGMIEHRLSEDKEAKGFIFDGFPRTVAQAEALDELLQKFDTEIHEMIALEVSEDELKKRLLERGKVSGRADDQDIGKIENRISVYKKQTLPVAEYYEKQGKYKGINGIGSIDEIFGRIEESIEAA